MGYRFTAHFSTSFSTINFRLWSKPNSPLASKPALCSHDSHRETSTNGSMPDLRSRARREMRAWHRPTAHPTPSRAASDGFGQVPRFRSRDGSISQSPKDCVRVDRARSEDPENGSRDSGALTTLLHKPSIVIEQPRPLPIQILGAKAAHLKYFPLSPQHPEDSP